MENILKIENLHKYFMHGKHTVKANDGVNLMVSPGQVVGLLGHNGAGKSTLVNQIIGLLRPDEGKILLAGINAVENPAQVRRFASVQAQANVPITGLTPRKAIELVGRIRGGEKLAIKARTNHLIDVLELHEWADLPSQKLSGGVARLTAFAMAAIMPGLLVILDEPTNDVDPIRRQLLWKEIRTLADNGAGVLLVTHNVREAERVVDKLLVLDHGKVIADDTPAMLIQSQSNMLTLEVDLSEEKTLQWPKNLSIVNQGHGRFTTLVEVNRAAEIVNWASLCFSHGQIERYALVPTSLEEVYVNMVSKEDNK